ncbi:hypothetical protein [Antrihabitans stalactiti]|nr:hypothetical protein [Antrihabitans stalactiti]
MEASKDVSADAKPLQVDGPSDFTFVLALIALLMVNMAVVFMFVFPPAPS